MGTSEAGESSSWASHRVLRMEGRETGESSSMQRQSHQEPLNRRTLQSRRETGESSGGPGPTDQGAAERRTLRSRYLVVKNLISDEREGISRGDSDRFESIFTEVESLHAQVQKPREQVADAEALLDIANTLVTSVKSHSSDGLTPSDFVTALLRNFGQDGGANVVSDRNVFSWSDIGLAIPHVFGRPPGCCTMIGPMNTEMKQRKAAVHRKRTKPTESARPEELDSELEVETDTDKNMSTMFDVLKKKRRVRLENLVLNRVSFAQTVENIFALSFLVKDGRAEISVNDSGHHLVSPRNAPAATSVASGNVSYNHFVFRFDFKDWKFMMNTVEPGEELMPHRSSPSLVSSSQTEPTHGDSESGAPSTPIRKLTRNRGLVVQEQSVVDDTPDREASLGRKGKRLYIGGS